MDSQRGPRLSVALCTYQGARYLEAQLQSILRQTRLPDEVVACDDGSTDETAALLERFAAAAPFSVRLYRNSTNLGSTKNFERAIALCEGEVIALADQDDVWLPHKLATLVRVFAESPALGLAFSDGLLVGDDLVPTGQRIWPNLPFPAAWQRRFDQGEGARLLLRYNLVTGAACAFRAALRPQLLPIPAAWVHDAWIGVVAASLAPAQTIATPLLHYRQHHGQQIGVARRTFSFQARAVRGMDCAYFAKRARCFQELAERLQSLQTHLRDPTLLDAVRGKVRHSEAQLRLHQASRFMRPWRALRELLAGNYHRYGRGLMSFAVDACL
jgi:glycosyltransferase involved in cell wall biosynthesis